MHENTIIPTTKTINTYFVHFAVKLVVSSSIVITSGVVSFSIILPLIYEFFSRL